MLLPVSSFKCVKTIISQHLLAAPSGDNSIKAARYQICGLESNIIEDSRGLILVRILHNKYLSLIIVDAKIDIN